MAIESKLQHQETQGSAAPETDRGFEALMGRAFDEKGSFAGLYESLHDLFFPKKLPPLELTSAPIAVPDRMKVKANPWAVGLSAGVNIAIVCLLLFWAGKKVIEQIKKPDVIQLVDVTPLKARRAPQLAGGGGGGERSPLEANKGKLPKLEKTPVSPPKVAMDKPKLARESAINVQKNLEIPDNPDMPMIGVKSSRNVALASTGQGSGGGLGAGSGNGLGSGSGGNTGGGVYRIGGGVSAPVLVRSVEAEFSDEARRSKYQGVCLVSIVVNAQGVVENARVVRSLGMGLDEKALEAVRQYRFKPALKDGKTPVAVAMAVEINFRLY